MIEPTTDATQAPAGYRLGDPIALCDFLALPPDGRRYVRDDQGRLTLMAPDRARGHRYPLNELRDLLARARPPEWRTLHEASVAFDPIYDLKGGLVPPSRLGLRTLAPDLSLYTQRPTLVYQDPTGKNDVFTKDGLVAVMELTSRGSFRADLGLGAADEVDRWRTFLENGVAEYWLLNANEDPTGLPPRSALFLRNEGTRWVPLPLEGARPASGEVHGLTPVHAGVVRSQVAPWLSLDLAALWEELDRLQARRG